MLASLRPHSPTDYSQQSHRLHHRPSLVMAKHIAPVVPSPLSPSSSQLHPDTAALSERRPSNARQRSWHHPYASPSVRAPPLDRSPEGRMQELHQHEYAASQARRASLTQESYHERAAGHSPYARTAYPLSPRLMLDGVGPQRNRGRANTLSLPRPDHVRPRDASYALPISARSPTTSAAIDHLGPPRSWDDRTVRRDSFASNFHPSRQSPPQLPPASPLLFAPLSAHRETPAYGVRRPSIPMAVAHPDRATVIRSRPGTPVSPLNMDSLSMEDSHFVPGTTFQSSPPDSQRHRDYAADRHRFAHNPLARSPHAPTTALEQRYEGREYAHHASPLSNLGASLATPRDQPRVQPPFTSHHARQPPGQNMPLSPAHLERDLYAQSQARNIPVYPEFEQGGDLSHQSRLRSASIAEGQHPRVDRIAHSRRRRRPPYSYASMITQAISSSPEGRMTLREIYTWISSNFNGYPMAGPDSQGWQNTVRHNLSLGKIFVKKQRTAQDIYDSCSTGNSMQSQAARGKGGWWTLHPVVLEQIRSGQRTHNDEFDDVERMVELDSAATAAGGPPSHTAAALEPSRSRQRSYSDSVNADAASNFRRTLPGAIQASTAPVSRQTSLRNPRDSNSAASSIESTPNMPSTPSVLQPKVEHAQQPVLQRRLRGYTTSTAEVPFRGPQKPDDSDLLDDEHYERVYGPTGPHYTGVPLPIEQQDVDMEPERSPPKHPEHILREAREELVSTRIQHIKQQQQQHQQQQQQQQQLLATSIDDSDNTPGRMNIRGLLNN